MGGAYDAQGWIPGLTLELSIEDVSGRVVHRGFGGVQPLAIYQAKFLSGRFETVPRGEWLSDVWWNIEAVRVALGPWAAPLTHRDKLCLLEKYQAFRDAKRKKRQQKPVLYTIDDALAWLERTPGLLSRPAPLVAFRSLHGCLAESFDFVVPPEFQADAEDPATDESADLGEEPGASAPAEAGESPIAVVPDEAVAVDEGQPVAPEGAEED